MKTIKLEVTITVPDDYQVDEPIWTLENAINRFDEDVELLNVNLIKQN